MAAFLGLQTLSALSGFIDVIDLLPNPLSRRRGSHVWAGPVMCLASHAPPKNRQRSTLTWLAAPAGGSREGVGYCPQIGRRANPRGAHQIVEVRQFGKVGQLRPFPLGHASRAHTPDGGDVGRHAHGALVVVNAAGCPQFGAAIGCGRQPCLPRKRCPVFSNACRKWPTSNVIGSAAQGWPRTLSLQRSELCSICC